MSRREYGYTFNGDPIFAHIQQEAPQPPSSQLTENVYVFVMGPYTAFDATCAYTDADKLESPFFNDPLFDRDQHVTDEGRGDYEAALKDVCQDLQSKFGVHAFIATDIDIPTKSQTDEDEPAMSVLDQSIAFAAVSDAVIFLFTESGLTTGTGSEVGAILGEFHLRKGNPEPIRKPRQRFRIYKTEDFGSASIDEIPSTYGIDTAKFTDKSDLLTQTGHFLANLERDDPDRPLPIFNPY